MTSILSILLATLNWIPVAERKPVDLDVELRTIEGQKCSLKQFRGQVTVLNMWATWCQPCKEELPALVELHKKFSPLGLQMLAITVEDRKTVKKFLDKNSLSFTVLLDPQQKLNGRLKARVVRPRLFSIGKAAWPFGSVEHSIGVHQM